MRFAISGRQNYRFHGARLENLHAAGKQELPGESRRARSAERSSAPLMRVTCPRAAQNVQEQFVWPLMNHQQTIEGRGATPRRAAIAPFLR